LIRGKSKGGNKNQSASRDKAKQQLAKAHHPASSPGAAASSHQSLTSHMSTSTSSLTGRNRERRLEPQRNEWDHYHGPDAARQMATIVETVTEPSPRAPSIDDGPSKVSSFSTPYLCIAHSPIHPLFCPIASYITYFFVPLHDADIK